MQTDLKTVNSSAESASCISGADPGQGKEKGLLKRYGLLRIILLLIIGIVLSLNIYKWNAVTKAGDALPMPFGWGSAVIMSRSMEPVLTVDDMVIVHEEDNYEIGDVVIYQNGGMLVIHRIVSIEGDTYILQGDANNAPDNPITKEMIKGKMVLSISNIGYIVRMIKNSTLVIILVFLVLCFAEYYWNKKKKAEQENIVKIKKEIALLRKEVQLADEKADSEAEGGNEI